MKSNLFDKEQRVQEFNEFVNRINSSKHSIWFDNLSSHQIISLFIEYRNFKSHLTTRKKSFSLRKFLFNMRERKKYKIPVHKMRESVLKKLLD